MILDTNIITADALEVYNEERLVSKFDKENLKNNKMKKLIQEVHEESGSVYQLYGEIEKCYHPDDYHTLVFKSVWTGAKDPSAEQIKGKVFLSPEGLQNLKDLLKDAK